MLANAAMGELRSVLSLTLIGVLVALAESCNGHTEVSWGGEDAAGAGGTKPDGSGGHAGTLAGGAGGASGAGGLLPDASAGSAGASAGGAAGASAGAAGASTGANTGAGGAAGDGGAVEICTNGIDDDGDQKIDCKDTDCEPLYRCAPAVPKGWSGPVAASVAPVPGVGCASSGGFGSLELLAGSGVIAPPAGCPACSCDPPTPSSCVVQLEMRFEQACAPSMCWGCSQEPLFSLTGTGTCKDMYVVPGAGDEMPQSTSYVYTAEGTCQPSASGNKSLVPPEIASAVHLCGGAPAGAGCGAGTCVPRASSPFAPTVCIYKAGDVGCPASGYQNKSLHFLDGPSELADSRSCTVCSCKSGPGGACAGTVSIYPDPSCTGQPVTFTSTSDCKYVNVGGPFSTGETSFSARYAAQPSSCVPGGGQPTGVVVPSKPLTLCCD